jgi:hypothetical protein
MGPELPEDLFVIPIPFILGSFLLQLWFLVCCLGGMLPVVVLPHNKRQVLSREITFSKPPA